jgi:hypothetical protein
MPTSQKDRLEKDDGQLANVDLNINSFNSNNNNNNNIIDSDLFKNPNLVSISNLKLQD